MARNRGRKGTRTKEMVQIARERMDLLFNLALDEARLKRFERANRYASLAVKIGMRYNVRLSRKYRCYYCRNCKVLLVSGINCRVRLRNGKNVITCTKCGRKYRYPYKTKNKS